MKYYIETNKGKMLKKLDTPVGAAGVWTWDPDEAWAFEEDKVGPYHSYLRSDGSSDRVSSYAAIKVMAFLKETCGHSELFLNAYDFEPMQIIAPPFPVRPDLYIDKLTHDIYSISGGRITSAPASHAVTMDPNIYGSAREMDDFDKQFEDMLIRGVTVVKING